MTPTSVTRILAREIVQMTRRELTAAEEARTAVLVADAVACALGALGSPTHRSADRFARSQGAGPASVIGSGARVPVPAAIMVNAALVRYLDYNDYFVIARAPGDMVVLHPSDSIPTALAVAQSVSASGRRTLQAVAIGYHVAHRLMTGIQTAMEFTRFHHGSLHSFVSAAVTAVLLDLDEDEVTHALGIAGSTATTNIIDNEGTAYSMIKSFADAMAACRGYEAALLAASGVTGPEDAVEGSMGFVDAVLRHRSSWALPDPEPGAAVMRAGFKFLPCEGTTHGFALALAGLARDGLDASTVEEVVIACGGRCARHTGDPAKRHPENKETADHSGPYVAAMAMLQGSISIDSFDVRHFADPTVNALIDKVSLVHDERFDFDFPAAEVSVRTSSGRVMTRLFSSAEYQALLPQAGDATFLSEKLLACTGDPEVADAVLAAANNFSESPDVDGLMEACAVWIDQ
jgi:2-methylcitrate dehydratase